MSPQRKLYCYFLSMQIARLTKKTCCYIERSLCIHILHWELINHLFKYVMRFAKLVELSRSLLMMVEYKKRQSKGQWRLVDWWRSQELCKGKSCVRWQANPRALFTGRGAPQKIPVFAASLALPHFTLVVVPLFAETLVSPFTATSILDFSCFYTRCHCF